MKITHTKHTTDNKADLPMIKEGIIKFKPIASWEYHGEIRTWKQSLALLDAMEQYIHNTSGNKNLLCMCEDMRYVLGKGLMNETKAIKRNIKQNDTLTVNTYIHVEKPVDYIEMNFSLDHDIDWENEK